MFLSFSEYSFYLRTCLFFFFFFFSFDVGHWSHLIFYELDLDIFISRYLLIVVSFNSIMPIADTSSIQMNFFKYRRHYTRWSRLVIVSFVQLAVEIKKTKSKSRLCCTLRERERETVTSCWSFLWVALQG